MKDVETVTCVDLRSRRDLRGPNESLVKLQNASLRRLAPATPTVELLREQAPAGYGNVYLLADSFGEFVDRLTCEQAGSD